MIRTEQQQTVKSVLRKILRGKEEPEAIARNLARRLPVDRPVDELLEEISRWLLALRDLIKQESTPPPLPMSQLLAAFQKVALERGIPAERFYPCLLERVILEAEAHDLSRSLPKQATKEKILDAALDVFSEKGFHLATVDEIAERAGVGKGTLYRYFANKETLFHELVRLRLEGLEKSAMAILDGQDDVLTMITKYLRIYFEFFDRNQRLYRLIVQERLDVGERVQDLYLKQVMRRIPLLKRKIYGASQEGILKEVDFQTVFYGVMGFSHGVIQKWLAHDCSYSLVEELPTVVEVLFYGFVKGSKDQTH